MVILKKEAKMVLCERSNSENTYSNNILPVHLCNPCRYQPGEYGSHNHRSCYQMQLPGLYHFPV